jgi:hypothetical protein
MLGSTVQGHSDGQDPSILEVEQHSFITIITIKNKVVESWEYVDYPSLKGILEDKHEKQKTQFEG